MPENDSQLTTRWWVIRPNKFAYLQKIEAAVPLVAWDASVRRKIEKGKSCSNL